MAMLLWACGDMEGSESPGGSAGALASTGWFKGVVYIAPDTKKRISGAKVVLSTGQSATTDKNGYWAFQLAPGTYTATASKAGYKPNSSTRTVVANADIWGSIGLTAGSVAKDSGAPDMKLSPDRMVAADLPAAVDSTAPADQAAAAADQASATTDGPGASADSQPATPFEPLDEGCSVAMFQRDKSGGTPLLLLLLLGLAALRRRG